MEFILIWVLCAIVCAILASQKNRNVAGWFILGALGGFISVIALLLMKPLNKSKHF
ncbi:hypothetical protein [Anaerobacterium chartisolvens]|uniref:hypothetical protein n=1 Tax=Anaerobacterium chartisolvens TaxID=1297424 RepID=UPI001474C51E|nr:hypothetical protein [Anaerobacterium chartisolvens]